METEENELCENCIHKLNIDSLDYICNMDGEPIEDGSFACNYYENIFLTFILL